MSGIDRIVHHLPTFHTDAEIAGRPPGEPSITSFDVLPLTTAYRRYLENLGLNYPDVNIYWDGLPVRPKNRPYPSEGWVRNVPKHNLGPVAELITELATRGATVMGLEDPVLISRSGILLAQADAAYSKGDLKLEESKLREVEKLVPKRDRFGSRIINSTLPQGRTGILFLGEGHDINLYHRPGLQVITPPDIAALVSQTSARLMSRPSIAS